MEGQSAPLELGIHTPMDSRERDKFYSKSNDEEDDADYELEPPDPEVIAEAERRGKEVIEASRADIDIDEIYRDAGQRRSDEILDGLLKNFKLRFRFQISHLLILTAVAAIVLTLAKLQLLGVAVFLLVVLSVAGLFFYLQIQERKAEEEATRRREEMYERRRAHMQKASGGGQHSGEDKLPQVPLPASTRASVANGDSWPTPTREGFRFRFSMAELLIAMTTAAIVFGLVHVMGSPSNTATVLGFVALIGLIVHAVGFEPPSVVVLGWWFVLVLYVCLSILAAVFPAIA
jgi:hypothetical protein